MVHVKWLGGAGLEFTWEGHTYLVDPYLTRNSKAETLFKRLVSDQRKIKAYIEKLEGRLSAVIIGHTHQDHAMDVPEISKYFDGPVIGCNSLDTLLETHGIYHRCRVTKGNELMNLPGGANVMMIPSRHGLVLFNKVSFPGDIKKGLTAPLRTSDYRLGTPFLPKLEIDGKTFLHAGSANFDEKQITGHKADVLFMCLPGWQKVPAYTRSFLTSVRPDIVVPFHFDDFSAPVGKKGKPKNLPFQNMKGFLTSIRKTLPDVEIRIPSFFKTMVF